MVMLDLARHRRHSSLKDDASLALSAMDCLQLQKIVCNCKQQQVYFSWVGIKSLIKSMDSFIFWLSVLLANPVVFMLYSST